MNNNAGVSARADDTETEKLMAEKKESVVMNVTGTFFREKVSHNKDAGLIGVINMLTEDVGNALEKHGGKLLCITRTGISAMFGDNCDNALQCAVTICQESKLEERKSIFRGIGIGIDYGTICVGTVGYRNFEMPLVVSEIMDTAVKLSEAAESFNSRILATSSAAFLVKDFRKSYNSRRLGKILHPASEDPEDIYDIFDGDLAETKYSKMRSRLFFETGVDLFLKGSYLEARSYFIELLKFDRNDAAAKQYVFRCDRCLAGTADENEKKYLDLR